MILPRHRLHHTWHDLYCDGAPPPGSPPGPVVAYQGDAATIADVAERAARRRQADVDVSAAAMQGWRRVRG